MIKYSVGSLGSAIPVGDTACLYLGDCKSLLRALPDDCIDSIVTDPPYGLEFMGKDWDRLDDWRDGGGFSKPGIGERTTPWTSFGGETANPSCRTCGGRRRGMNQCSCEQPDWHVKGKKFDERERTLQRLGAQQAWHYQWTIEAYRVLKPGGHMLAFGGTRTYHRMAVAIEDAGFEIRDRILAVLGGDADTEPVIQGEVAWVYGSG